MNEAAIRHVDQLRQAVIDATAQSVMDLPTGNIHQAMLLVRVDDALSRHGAANP